MHVLLPVVNMLSVLQRDSGSFTVSQKPHRSTGWLQRDLDLQAVPTCMQGLV